MSARNYTNYFFTGTRVKIFVLVLTKRAPGCIMTYKQTVDAEITAVMTSQRAHGGVSWVRNKLSNGPLRAQGKGASRVYCDA